MLIESVTIWRLDYARLSTSILAVDWLFAFNGRPINYCFVHLAAVLLAFVDRFVSVSSQASVPIWMKGPPRCLAREKAAKWKVYKKIRREFGRNHKLAVAALDAFNGVNLIQEFCKK